MLYNGSDVIRDLEWVIFDEVHYINDAEVGRVQWRHEPQISDQSPCYLKGMFWIELTAWLCVFCPSAVLYGKKYSSCCRNMSTSYCSAQPYPIHSSLPNGSGKRALILFKEIDRSIGHLEMILLKRLHLWAYNKFTWCVDVVFVMLLLTSLILTLRRTKKRRVYVVSTTKRPVPLEHHLYTGNSNKTSSELFLLVDSKKTFLQNG